MKYTVVGVDDVLNERVVLHVDADNVDDAEDAAYAHSANLLIAGTFIGKLFPESERKHAKTREYALRVAGFE